MPDRETYPAGVPCWVDVAQPDLEAGVRFYGELFGWAITDGVPAGSPSPYLVADVDGRDAAGLRPATEGEPAAWHTYVSVESADATAERVRPAGGTVLAGPVGAGENGRMAVVADPSGAVFCLWEPRKRQGAVVVNAPNSWNWSNLHTPDRAGAEAFYGAVLGWELSDFGPAGAMWRRPGYGDFLEALEPGVRERQDGAGAPPGFADAVGWVIGTEAGQGHWSVTFSVADTDRIAERAVALGGTVEVEPYSAPFVRAASLRDPQGAPFEVNTYTGG